MASAAGFRPLILVAALAAAGCDPVKEALPWQSFSVASTSMEPTLPKGTYVTGASVALSDLARGDLLVVRHGDEHWVSRLAAVPGDTIALVGGTVMLNGKPVAQRGVGTWSITDSPRPGPSRMLTERFPGESRRHRVLDSGPSVGDNYPEIRLGSDQYFMLGDNRDNAADSRFDSGASGFGLGVIRGRDIVRRVDPDSL